MGGSGLTAWGIITIIVVVIVIGFCGYYGIICYPLFADKGRRYDNMDGNSTTTTTSSPTRSPDFGKMDYEEEEFRGYPKLSSEKAQWAAANWKGGWCVWLAALNWGKDGGLIQDNGIGLSGGFT